MSKAKIFLFLQFLFFAAWPAIGQDPGAPDSVWVEVVNSSVPAGGGDVIFKIRFLTDNIGQGNGIAGIGLPLHMTNSNPGANPILDTSKNTTFSGTAAETLDLQINAVVTDSGNPSTFPLQYNLGAISLDTVVITSGLYTFAYLKIHLTDTTTICIDTQTFQSEGGGTLSLQFVTYNIIEYIPKWSNLCSRITPPLPIRQDSLVITAYSPVNLVVTDPKQDSIGLDTTGSRPDTIFNTILEGSTYDTTQDVSEPPDGIKDDVVRIPNPYVGEYKIRVVPDGEGTYSLGIRIDGSDKVLLANNVVVPDTSTTYEYAVLITLRGDVNRDTGRNLTDIIFLVNYIFKAGTAPNPAELGNVNCSSGAPNLSDIVYMVNYVFKGGNAPCS